MTFWCHIARWQNIIFIQIVLLMRVPVEQFASVSPSLFVTHTDTKHTHTHTAQCHYGFQSAVSELRPLMKHLLRWQFQLNNCDGILTNQNKWARRSGGNVKCLNLYSMILVVTMPAGCWYETLVSQDPYLMNLKYSFRHSNKRLTGYFEE